MIKRPRKAPKRKSTTVHQKKTRAQSTNDRGNEFNITPEMHTRILTADEKHELIVAHTLKQQMQKKLGMGYYVAVIVSCLVVVTGWTLVMRENFGLQAIASNDPALQTIQDSIKSFKRTTEIRFPETRKNFMKTKEQFLEARALETNTVRIGVDETKE